MPLLEIDFTPQAAPPPPDRSALVSEPAEAERRQQPFLALADGYQVGAIVDSSWGYDQTNIDFYRIEKRTGQFVTLLPLKSALSETAGGFMSGHRRPLTTPKDYLADHDVAWGNKDPESPKPAFRRKLCFRDGKPVGLTISHGWCSLWNGKPQACSWYA